MRIISTIILIIFFSGSNIYCKNKKIDSLLNVLHKNISVNEKVNTYIRLSNEFRVRNIDSALYFSEKALRLSVKIEEDSLMAASYNSLATVYLLLSDYDKAKDFFNKSIRLFSVVGDSAGLAVAYTNIGTLFDETGDYKQALDYHLKSLNIFRNQGMLDDVAKTYNNIGLIHFRMSSYEKALEYYNKSLDIRIKLGDTLGLALIYNNIGIIYYYEEKYEKVLEYFKKALKIWEDSGNKRQSTMALYNLGELYYELSLYKSALNYTKEAYNIDVELKDQYTLIGDHLLLGKIYLEMKEFDLAKQEYFMALELAQQLNADTDIIDIYQCLSDYYLRIRDYKTSLEYFKKYHDLNDSIFSVQKNKIITEMQTKYETEQKEQKIELLHNKNKLAESELNKQKLLTIFLFAGIFFILIITILIVRRSIERKKVNTALRLKNAEILQQKEEIETQRDEIESQRDEIERQRDFVTAQRDLISKQKEAITDSIIYAERIQRAILPPEKLLKNILKEYFIYFLPKDVVSGDFYWIAKINKYTLFTVVDCTGHGVPGAFMSMLGISYLNEIVKKSEVYNTGLVLDKLREYVIESLQQKDIYNEDTEDIKKLQNVQDGMDMAFCALDTETNILQFSGANNSLYLIRNKNKTKIKNTERIKTLENETHILYEFKPDKMPIAIYKRMNNFITQEIQLIDNDMIYLFTDGFADQFGGSNSSKKGGVKFKYKPFKKLLLEIADKPVKTQKDILKKTYIDWKGNYDQIDDILIFGIRI